MKKAARLKKHTKKKVSYSLIYVLSCLVIALLFVAKYTTQIVVTAQLLPDARYRYDERRSGLSGSKDILTTPGTLVGNTALPTWEFKCPDTLGSSLPAVTKDSVYIYCFGVGDRKGLYAFNINPAIDPVTKQAVPRWKNTLTDSRLCGASAGTFSSSLEVVGNVIYFNVCYKTVAINTNGTYKWSYTHKQYYAPSSVSPPIVGDGRVYISTSKGAAPVGSELIAVSVNSSGVLSAANNLWTLPAPAPGVWNHEMTAGLDGKTLFTVGNSATGLVAGNGYIWMVNGTNGTIKSGWPITTSFGPGQQFYPPSSLREGNVYVGASTGWVYAYSKTIDPITNKPPLMWSFKAASAVSPRITLGKKMAIFADNAGSLYAIDNDSTSSTYKTLKWKVSYGAAGAGSVVNSSMTNDPSGVVYIGNYQGEVKAFKATGISGRAPLWTVAPFTTATAKIVRDVVVVDSRLYVKNDEGYLKVYKGN